MKDWVLESTKQFHFPESIRLVYLHEMNPEPSDFYKKEDFVKTPGCIPRNTKCEVKSKEQV